MLFCSEDKFFKKKDLNKILAFMSKDKKNNSNKINLVLLSHDGRGKTKSSIPMEKHA